MRKLILASLIVLALQLILPAKDLDLATPAAGVVALQGSVFVTPPGKSSRPCQPEEVLKKGWKLETRDESSADLLLWDKSTIRISQNTSITLVDLTETEDGNLIRKIEVATGRVWVDAQKSNSPKDTFEVKGPQAVAAVKGTAFVVDADDPGAGTSVQVFDGAVQCTALDGTSDLVGVDSEFVAPLQGKPRKAAFVRSKVMAGDNWLARNWQSRLEMMEFFKTHPGLRRTINLAKMDPAVRAWMIQHFKRHPNQFRPKPQVKPTRRPINRRPLR